MQTHQRASSIKKKSMLLTAKWISATSHKQSSFITHSLAWKKWRKKIRRGKKTVRLTSIFWLMNRKLRQFPRRSNKQRGENARGAFQTTMHHNLQNRALIPHLFMRGDTFTSGLSADAVFTVTGWFRWVTEQNWQIKRATHGVFSDFFTVAAQL